MTLTISKWRRKYVLKQILHNDLSVFVSPAPAEIVYCPLIGRLVKHFSGGNKCNYRCDNYWLHCGSKPKSFRSQPIHPSGIFQLAFQPPPKLVL